MRWHQNWLNYYEKIQMQFKANTNLFQTIRWPSTLMMAVWVTKFILDYFDQTFIWQSKQTNKQYTCTHKQTTLTCNHVEHRYTSKPLVHRLTTSFQNVHNLIINYLIIIYIIIIVMYVCVCVNMNSIEILNQPKK